MTWANKLHHYWNHYPSTKVTMDRCAGNLEPASPVLIMNLNLPWDQTGKAGWPVHLCSSSISKEPIGTCVVLPFQKMELLWKWGFPGGVSGKEPACNAGDPRDEGSIPGSGRSPGVGNGNPCHILAWKIPWTEEPGGLQYTGSQKSQTQLSD